MGSNNRLEIDVVAKLGDLEKKVNEFIKKVEKDGIEAPVSGKFDEFNAEYEAVKRRVENTPIYANVSL